MSTDETLPIPGLDEPSALASDLERQVRATIRSLNDEGLVQPRHAARIQLAIELAQIVTLKRRTGRVSTVGNDARVLMELLDQLLPDEGDSATDVMLRNAMAEWAEVIARAEQSAPGDAAAEVRDTA